MSRVLLILCMGLLLVCGSAYAFDDNFDSYTTGPLSTVSGGVWNTWGGNSPDASVVTGGLSSPNAMRQDGGDVVTYWNNLFAGANQAQFGFDFLTHEVSSNPDDKDVDCYVLLGSGNPGDYTIDYGTGPGIFILDWWSNSGTTTLHIWDTDGAAGGGDYGIIELDLGLTLDTWHRVDLFATLTETDPLANDPNDADGYFDVFLNGNKVLANQYFGMNNANGLNATEIYSFLDEVNPNQDEYILIDNVCANPVPEPGSMLALCSGLLGLAGFAIRRRK